MLPFCPESPKYLLITKDDEFEAEEALAWFRNTWEITEELNLIRHEKQLLDGLPKITFKRMFQDVALRTPLTICFLAMVGQQLCGINAVHLYLHIEIRILNQFPRSCTIRKFYSKSCFKEVTNNLLQLSLLVG